MILKKHKSILLIASYTPSVVNFRKELILSLLDTGYSVSVIAPKTTAEITAQIQELGCIFLPIKMDSRGGVNPLKDMLYLAVLTSILIKTKPDCILSYTIKPVIWGTLAAKIAGIKKSYSIITGLGYAFTDIAGWKKKSINCIVRKLYGLALKMNTKTFFQNPDDQVLFEELKLVQPDKAILINGSGVNLNEFSKSPPPAHKVKFLLLARLLRDKGIYEFIEAARKIKHKYPQARFSIGGYIDQNPTSISKSDLEAWINEGIIDYLGNLTNVREAIKNCSVYVLPSYREGTPRSVLEAMAMGRPIITTDVPGCRETVIDGVNGFLVPVKNVNALVEKMELFIQNPEQCTTMGHESRRIAEEKFDVHHVNKIIMNTLLEEE